MNSLTESPPTVPKILTASVTAGGDFQISWSAEKGKQYRLQYRDQLGDGTWIDLPIVEANGPIASTTTLPANLPQRFYRIVRLAP